MNSKFSWVFRKLNLEDSIQNRFFIICTLSGDVIQDISKMYYKDIMETICSKYWIKSYMKILTQIYPFPLDITDPEHILSCIYFAEKSYKNAELCNLLWSSLTPSSGTYLPIKYEPHLLCEFFNDDNWFLRLLFLFSFIIDISRISEVSEEAADENWDKWFLNLPSIQSYFNSAKVFSSIRNYFPKEDTRNKLTHKVLENGENNEIVEDSSKNEYYLEWLETLRKEMETSSENELKKAFYTRLFFNIIPYTETIPFSIDTGKQLDFIANITTKQTLQRCKLYYTEESVSKKVSKEKEMRHDIKRLAKQNKVLTDEISKLNTVQQKMRDLIETEKKPLEMTIEKLNIELQAEKVKSTELEEVNYELIGLLDAVDKELKEAREIKKFYDVLVQLEDNVDEEKVIETQPISLEYLAELCAGYRIVVFGGHKRWRKQLTLASKQYGFNLLLADSPRIAYRTNDIVMYNICSQNHADYDGFVLNYNGLDKTNYINDASLTAFANSIMSYLNKYHLIGEVC